MPKPRGERFFEAESGEVHAKGPAQMLAFTLCGLMFDEPGDRESTGHISCITCRAIIKHIQGHKWSQNR